MSSDTVISVEGLSKRYVIEHESRHDNLRDTLHHTARKLWRRFRWGTGFKKEEFWALKDVSFDVKRGEVIGIIGRNGAGKSTLLKILSRITEPTEGTVTIKGRVASLLEVGTGFHPELSGRENIFLNGAILGMSRAEIRRKFDEIVAFAEVEKFLDTPVKHYSSGMYVRLAFAVAAHLEPEILIVDEVLAVGDSGFQRKCLSKMEQVAGGGRTILFVSHNLDAVAAICQSALLLTGGRRTKQGPARSIISTYQGVSARWTMRYDPAADRPSVCGIEIDSAALQQGELRVRVAFTSPVPLRPPVVGLVVTTREGRPIFGTNMRMHPPAGVPAATRGVCTLSVPRLPLHSDTYGLSIWLGDGDRDYDVKTDALFFDFVGLRETSGKPRPGGVGPLDLDCEWSIEPL